ncbi:hypothetical protein EIN43_09440 [Enterobacter hormaechei]|uniref:Uncharacterized protein n=1 Tax=Enterobacter hormaechei TaxID=158836 RepID=A0A4Y5ZVF2_9ENTR|nr:hypothetical protein EIN43_09440 [Enterobacter hormaechei]
MRRKRFSPPCLTISARIKQQQGRRLHRSGDRPATEAASNIRYFHSSQYINDTANGDICVAIGWAGDVWQAANRAKEAKRRECFLLHSEGGALAFFDVFAMPADAKTKRKRISSSTT